MHICKVAHIHTLEHKHTYKTVGQNVSRILYFLVACEYTIILVQFKVKIKYSTIMYLYPLYVSYMILLYKITSLNIFKKTQGEKTNDKFRTHDRYMSIM